MRRFLFFALRRDESFDEIEKLGSKSRAGAIRVMGTIA
jgi:hypothetical protein